MEQNKYNKHINSFVFQSYINNQSLAKNKSKAFVEKEYYFDLFFSISKMLYSNLIYPQNPINFMEIKVFGNSQTPINTFWDFLTLVNYLRNKLRSLSLVVSHQIKPIDDTQRAVVCTLYYSSIITKQKEAIQITFIGDCPQQSFTSSDDSGSGSGIKKETPEQLKLKEYEEMFKLYAADALKDIQIYNDSKPITPAPTASSKTFTPNDLKIINAVNSIVKNNPPNLISPQTTTESLQSIFNEQSTDLITPTMSKLPQEGLFKQTTYQPASTQPKQSPQPEVKPTTTDEVKEQPKIDRLRKPIRRG